MANVYQRGRQFEKAFEHLDKASQLADSDRANVDLLFAYASLHERAKEYEQAEAKFRELLEIAPNHAPALNYLGYMFADLNVRIDEAQDLVQKALDIEPYNGAYLDSLGWVYYRQNKLNLAAEYLERSLKQYKDDPVVLSHLGEVYFKLGRVAEAKGCWSRSLAAYERTAPADRDTAEIQSLERKLAEVEVSMAGDKPVSAKKGIVRR